jgi:hypothetical protein
MFDSVIVRSSDRSIVGTFKPSHRHTVKPLYHKKSAPSGTLYSIFYIKEVSTRAGNFVFDRVSHILFGFRF